MTQKTPTQKSATAKLARKKFVIDLSLLDIVTTNMTRRLPAIENHNAHVSVCNVYSIRSRLSNSPYAYVVKCMCISMGRAQIDRLHTACISVLDQRKF